MSSKKKHSLQSTNKSDFLFKMKFKPNKNSYRYRGMVIRSMKSIGLHMIYHEETGIFVFSIPLEDKYRSYSIDEWIDKYYDDIMERINQIKEVENWT